MSIQDFRSECFQPLYTRRERLARWWRCNWVAVLTNYCSFVAGIILGIVIALVRMGR